MLTNFIVDDKETWEVNRANMLRKSLKPFASQFKFAQELPLF